MSNAASPVRSQHRRGTLIILVAGMVSMLAVLAVTFLARMRTDSHAADHLVRLAQCRLMLHAAMSYVQEASRLGYARMSADGECLDAREAWGWVDVRDAAIIGRAGEVAPGSTHLIGPRDASGAPLYRAGTWPALGTAMRAPMHRWVRPPWAVRPTIVPNRIPNDEQQTTIFGIPFPIDPDPIPAIDPDLGGFDLADGASERASKRRSWSKGDPLPVQTSVNLSWFRLYREQGGEPGRPADAGPVGATFIVTVGDGGTLGFRDWDEVLDTPGASAQFGSSLHEARDLFEDQAASEVRQWFRIEWSPAVGGGEDSAYLNSLKRNNFAPEGADTWFASPPINTSRFIENSSVLQASPSHPRNYIGTIRYLQRLAKPPAKPWW